MKMRENVVLRFLVFITVSCQRVEVLLFNSLRLSSMREFPYSVMSCFYFICILKHNSHQKRNQKTHRNQKFSDSIRNFLIPSLTCSWIPILLSIICAIWNQKFSDSSENF